MYNHSQNICIDIRDTQYDFFYVCVCLCLYVWVWMRDLLSVCAIYVLTSHYVTDNKIAWILNH